jgi:hypothetical protein
MDLENPESRMAYAIVLADNHCFEKAYSLVDRTVKDFPEKPLEQVFGCL